MAWADSFDVVCRAVVMTAGLQRIRAQLSDLSRFRGRLQLRVTVLTTALLLLVPAVALRRLPRHQAQGLGRLLRHAALVQSFPAPPQRPVPQLWKQRLGDASAEQLWQRQQRLWWQFWGRHGDGGAYLAMPTPRPIQMGTMPMPANSLRVNDLMVVAADPLSHQLLADQLDQPLRRNQGLEKRCLMRLQREQAAFWSPEAFGSMMGPLAPLLQSFQEGCISLQLEGNVLDLEGEAAAVAGLLAKAPVQSPASLRDAPLPPELLLELEGGSLGVLLKGLLGRQLIRDPLAARYGIGPSEISLLRRTPFRLGLRSLEEGPFQAGLELQLVPGSQRKAWARLLVGLREALTSQGFEEVSVGYGQGDAPLGTKTLPASTWRRESGDVVGGWRWISPTGEEPQLLVFLGPLPPLPKASRPVLPAPQLRLQLRPKPLARLGLLPRDLPAPIQRANQLTVLALGAEDGAASISQLKGRLKLGKQPR